jgi:hypothetical protein
MSQPQAVDAGESSKKDDKTIEIGDAETNASSDGDECPVVAAPTAKPRIASKDYVYDPSKITLKFIFANRDGVNVVLECKPSDTVGEVKGALLSVWPQGEMLCILTDWIRPCFYLQMICMLLATTKLPLFDPRAKLCRDALEGTS